MIPISTTDHVYNMILTDFRCIISPIWTICGIIIFIFSGFVWILPRIFSFTKISNIEFRSIPTDELKKYQRKTIWSSSKGTNGKPSGLIVGKWFIGKIEENRGKWCHPILTVMVTSDSHNLICDKEPDDNKIEEITHFNNFENTSVSLGMTNYMSVDCKLTSDIPRDFQIKIIDNIKFLFEKKKHLIVFLSGSPGLGKSSVSDHLMKSFAEVEKIKSSFCSDFSFVQAGESWANLWCDVETEENPFIVLIDEVDEMFKGIINNTISKHKDLRTPVTSKKHWNNFCDKVGKNRYENLILILTTNLTLKEIDNIDPSFTRPGRIDIRFEIHKDEFITQVPSDDGLKWM